MKIGETHVEPTYAEALAMPYVRLAITAADPYWAEAAAREAAGYGTSMLGCDAEAGIDRKLGHDETPDSRLGVGLLIFGRSIAMLKKAVCRRVGQCVMTCPTTAVFDGLPDAEFRIPLGRRLRFFGDGAQKGKQIDGRRYWRIPVMDGEFLVEATAGAAEGIGGVSLVIESADVASGLVAARRAVEAVAGVPGAIAPFPGGVSRAGAKIGSRYPRMGYSTFDAYCPLLRGRVDSRLHPETNCAYLIVIDAVDEPSARSALSAALHAAACPGVVQLSALNYGGQLGPISIGLEELLEEPAAAAR